MKLEKQAETTMKIQEEYANNNLLPVNVNKTKAMLVHDIVAPQYPKIKYKENKIEFVKRFKYLGVEITTKLGWGIYIEKRLKKARKIFNALRIIFTKIPIYLYKMRRKLCLAYGLPQIIWLFSCWFFYTEIQQRDIDHLYCSGLQLVYNLTQWDDLTVYIITRESSLSDYLFKYWTKFNAHLNKSPEANLYQQTFSAYLAAKTPQRAWYLSMGLRKNDKYVVRFSKRARHSKIDVSNFLIDHHQQYGRFRLDSASFLAPDSGRKFRGSIRPVPDGFRLKNPTPRKSSESKLNRSEPTGSQ
ncbi:unnamed protein product [Adineta ricciae]|uniref:Uncharacterized protein n=1 Tax=Adineta ricciae TaxID=249248 RepID=A0A815JXH4_ADIRI|nr:unnamed protein product [Adineta ricciae]CAF1387536.1 unnamed protein product [Adineta ricciae]